MKSKDKFADFVPVVQVCPFCLDASQAQSRTGYCNAAKVLGKSVDCSGGAPGGCGVYMKLRDLAAGRGCLEVVLDPHDVRRRLGLGAVA